MKIAWKIFMVIALVAVAISCLKVEPTPQFTKSAASLSVTGSVASVAVTATDSLSNVISFTWTDPQFAVGIDKSKFSIVVGATGKNFVSFSSKDITGVLGGTLLGKEINAMALKFGGVIGQPVTLDVKVVASQLNNNEPMSSNVIQVAVTPYGDLGLKATPLAVVCTAATSSKVGTVLTWGTAFNGYTGVKMYQLQYAKGGTSFASPTSSAVTSYTQSYTQLDLNKIALGYGVAGGSSGTVDFRIKASNESGTVEYSNVVTVTITTYVANNSVGIIGDATPGGWNIDTDMYRPDPINKPADWTVILYLIGGKSAKFRADDDWATNWGAAGFPTGTGTQDGANIPVLNSGYYRVNFNAGSGAYTFTLLTPTVYTAMIITGDFSGWSTSTGVVNLTADVTGHIWTGTFTQTDATNGQLKIVGNGSHWYGDSTFPSGYGIDNGPNNITVPVGTYFVYFNDLSGEYLFGSKDNNASAGTPYTQIGLTGDFISWSTSSEPHLIQDPTNPYKWSAKITLTAGGSKFIDNGGSNWWGVSSPGIATLTGANIAVTAGNPQVTFNTATGEYTFSY